MTANRATAWALIAITASLVAACSDPPQDAGTSATPVAAPAVAPPPPVEPPATPAAPAAPSPVDAPVAQAKIAVMRDGTVTVDGERVAVEEVDAHFRKLKDEGIQRFLYYREGAPSEPHPNAQVVIMAIVSSDLPVVLANKPDYSDAVAPGAPPAN